MKHEKIGTNEVFVGNTDHVSSIPLHLKSLKTIRFGKQALDINGETISLDHMLPLIIEKSEMNKYDAIMMARLNDK
ncbi:MAG: hypothetical protein QM504_11230 [Pseudomonadota bacterium]